MPKAFDDQAKAAYVEEIENGSGRLDAARSQEVKPAIVEEAMNNDPNFRRRVELAERLKVHDSLVEAATSGNVPAIESFLRRNRAADEPPPAPPGAIADVRRLIAQMEHVATVTE